MTLRFTLHRRRWTFRRVRADELPNQKWAGWCDLKRRRIRVWDGLKERDELETVLHELWHAAHPYMDEEWVQVTARDVSRVLWRLGWRRQS